MATKGDRMVRKYETIRQQLTGPGSLFPDLKLKAGDTLNFFVNLNGGAHQQITDDYQLEQSPAEGFEALVLMTVNVNDSPIPPEE